MKLRSMMLAVATVASLAIPGSSQAAQAPIGPTYPGPGNLQGVGTGDNGVAGGRTWTYAGVDSTTFSSLWWALADGRSAQLAMDGAVDAPAETLAFDPSSSNLVGGVMRYVGAAAVVNAQTNTTSTFPTRLSVTVTDINDVPIALVDRGAVAIPESGGAAPITSDFKVNMLFEVGGGAGFVPAKTFFDSYPTLPTARLIRSTNGAFFFVPPPSVLTASPVLLDTSVPGPTLSLTAHLHAQKTGMPLAGKSLTFTTKDLMGATVTVCSAETSPQGDASCSAPDQLVAAVIGQGYDVAYAGGNDYLPSAAHASLIA